MAAVRFGALACTAFVLALVGTDSIAAAGGAKTRLVSVSSAGEHGNDGSGASAVSADGRTVVFQSRATNLVPVDTNGVEDVFLRNRRTGQTRRISVGPMGVEADDSSYAPSISANGRFVVFQSRATNLVPGDTNGFVDIFVFDRLTGQVERVSVSSGGGIQGNDDSYTPSISANGRFVAFDSDASSLIPGDTNGYSDVYVRDLQTDRTRRITVTPGGGEANNQSYDSRIAEGGRFVVFLSDATNLTKGDGNAFTDVFIRDRKLGVTRRVSVSSHGAAGNGDAGFAPSVSPDGRFVAFESEASNLVPGDTNGFADVFLRDRKTKTTLRVSVVQGNLEPDGVSQDPRVSADGRMIAFASEASNLVGGDANASEDIFVRDRAAHRTRRVTVGVGGAEANHVSFLPMITRDGRFVTFTSLASNLVTGDLNADEDVFLRGPLR